MSPTMTIPNDLSTRLRERESQNQQTYELLVQDVLDGKEVDCDHAQRTLAAVGKSPADLDAAVKRLRRIAELQAVVSRRDRIESAFTEATTKRSEEMRQEQKELTDLQTRISTNNAVYQGLRLRRDLNMRQIDFAAR
jgi:hypothetical protein